MMDMNPTTRADWTMVMASTGTQPNWASDSDTPLHLVRLKRLLNACRTASAFKK